MSQQPGPPYGSPPPHGYAPPPRYGYDPRPELSPADQRLWGMLAHVSAIVSVFLGLTFLGPLVIYLVLKDRGVFVRRQSAEALNFQILVNVVLLGLSVVGVVTLGFGFLLLPVVAVVGLVLVIIAAVQANQGVDYRYPLNWRLVR